MKSKLSGLLRLLVGAVAIVMMAAVACGGDDDEGRAAQDAATSAPAPQLSTPAQTGNETVPNEVEAAARKLLADELEAGEGDLRLDSAEGVQWSDASLGCPQEGRGYAQVITPGYKLVFDLGGTSYAVHTNSDGSHALVCGDGGLGKPALPLDTPAPSADEIVPEEIETAARKLLADELEAGEGDLRLDSAEGVQWSDASLGCPQEGRGYAQVITPGYKLVFDLGGTSYAVHTNSDGSHALVCEDGGLGKPALPLDTPAPSADETVPEEIETAARKLLADELGAGEGDFRLASSEGVQWSDASLGCPQEGRGYAQVITPGYKLVFDLGGTSYAVHTNADGSHALVCEDGGLGKPALPLDTPAPSADETVPEEIEAAARKLLADELEAEEGDLRLASAEGVQWSDASLGCPQEGMGYAHVITPGYKLVFDLAGTSYAVHTNSDGSHAVVCGDG